MISGFDSSDGGCFDDDVRTSTIILEVAGSNLFCPMTRLPCPRAEISRENYTEALPYKETRTFGKIIVNEHARRN